MPNGMILAPFDWYYSSLKPLIATTAQPRHVFARAVRPCAGWFAEVLRILAPVLNGQEERLFVGVKNGPVSSTLPDRRRIEALLDPARLLNYKQSVVHKFVNTFVLAAAGDVRYDLHRSPFESNARLSGELKPDWRPPAAKIFKVELHGGQIVAGFKMRVIWP